VAVDWQLQLDPDAIFKRLIHDVNPEPAAFLRELLQNSFDASRCHLYERMSSAGEALPQYPHQAPGEWRDQFPVRITRATTQRFNDLSQEDEEREVIIVEDSGIGMDRETILKYLLQIGRSYYTSEDFLRRYPFVPTSRFGIGFLSVFDNADEVRVETLRAGANDDAGIALTLKGPRSYVLTERIHRPTVGTRIEVTLRKPLELDLPELIRKWCKRVEFPLIVSDQSEAIEVKAESPIDFCYEEPDVVDEEEVMGVRAFPITGDGIDGELYVFYCKTDRGESWAKYPWAAFTYPELHPEARSPRLPESHVLFHGMALLDQRHHYLSHGGVAARVDYRRDLEGISLNRQVLASMPEERLGMSDPHVQAQVIELVRAHLAETDYARGENAWSYKQRLIQLTGFNDFWADQPGVVRVFIDGSEELRSFREVRDRTTVTVLARVYRSYSGLDLESEPRPPDVDGFAIWGSDLRRMPSSAREYLFSGLAVDEAYWADDHYLSVLWRHQEPTNRIIFGWGSQVADTLPLPDSGICLRTHRVLSDNYEHLLLNSNHEFVGWLTAVHEAASEDPPKVAREEWESLTKVLESPLWHRGLNIEKLTEFLEGWRASNIADLPPPEEPLTQQMFMADPLEP
jgi:hypothetical protein